MPCEKYPFAILMTACIAPKATTRVQRKDPLLRLKDYQTALHFWLHYPDERIREIVFTDNSGYDLSSLKALAEDNPYHREIEFLQVVEPPLPPANLNLGYGYGEGDLMDQSFMKSKILAASEYIVKVTGRLYFPDLSRLISRMRKDVDILIDGRHIPFQKAYYVATTLFIVRHDFYMNHLYGIKEKILTERVGIEGCYYKTLIPLYRNNKKKIQLRFPVNAPPVGIGAHWNKNYSAGIWRCVEVLRGFFRMFLPFLWL